MPRRFSLTLAVCLLALPAALRANDPVAEALEKNGHWKRLRAWAEPRVHANPNDAYASYVLGHAKFEFGDLEGAEKLLEKAVALEPKNASHHFMLSAAYGRQAESANFFRQPGLARKFKREAEAAAQLDPNHIGSRAALVQFHWRAPGLIGGDKKQIPILLAEIMRISPAEGHLEAAAQARRENPSTLMEPYYLKALAADPKSYRVQLSLAGLYSTDQHKKYDLSEKHAREAMKLEPDRVSAYISLAALFAFQGRWADLDAILAQSEKAIPDNLSPYYHAARVLIGNNKEPVRAERHLRKYLTQPPEANAPTQADGYWRLGNALEKQGRYSEAIAALEQALRLDKGHDGAKKDLKRLK